MGVREIVIGLIALLAIYLLVLGWRWQRVSARARRGRRGPIEATRPEVSALSRPREPVIDIVDAIEDDEEDNDAVVRLSAPRSSLDAFYREPAQPPAQPAPAPAVRPAIAPVNAPAAAPVAGGFEAALELRQLRQMLDAQRVENDALRDDLETLRAEVGQLRQRLENMPRTPVHVAPQYGEAVGLARSGLDSLTIAERCGISVSEAQLVRALAASPQEGD
ncbi:DUF2802 domain-containing protein [Uliginosibacterium sp. sgz301328]|uniref:DUF2802 domain-containing protein n=1 Tax=Uliginosibacterium sp. sgz301328 TaxID=3243764 RepID=UPI00359EB6D8